MKLDRGTKKVVLKKSGVTAEILEYLTKSEVRQISHAFLSEIEITTKAGQDGKREVQTSGVKATVQNAMEDATLRAVVSALTSADGSERVEDKNEIVRIVLNDIPEADCAQLIEEINRVTDPKER